MHRTDVPLTFAHDAQGVLRHVDDVGRGLACDCVCPACGARLIAKQGSVLAHTFAHESGSECAHGVETALHLAAKELLLKEGWLMLPALIAKAQALDSSGRLHRSERSIARHSMSFDEVTSEVRLGRVVPDIVATGRGTKLLVEVAVTHFVRDEPEKLSRLIEIGIPAIEIDLSSMPQGWSRDMLRDAVLKQVENKSWLFNPGSVDLQAEAVTAATMLAAQADRDEQLRRERAMEALERARGRTPGFLAATSCLREFLTTERRAAERARMNADGPNSPAWRHWARALGLDWDAPLAHINIELPNEMGWPVDRRVWQATLFGEYVAQNPHSSFRAAHAANHCRRTFGVRPEFAVLYRHGDLLTDWERQNLPSPADALREYFEALQRLGYIAPKGSRYYVVRRQAARSHAADNLTVEGKTNMISPPTTTTSTASDASSDTGIPRAAVNLR